jgi:hypothetical protein
MALGFGSAVALLVTLLNVFPRAGRAPGEHRPDSVERTSGSPPPEPKALAAPEPKALATPEPTGVAAPEPKPTAAPRVSPPLASEPSILDPDPRRSDARSTVLPAATELVGERRPKAAVVMKPHRAREVSSSARDRSTGSGARSATSQPVDPLGTRR